ncbi:MAG: phosphatase domain-containing protein [Candidatus Sericytochromatia bacterium]
MVSVESSNAYPLTPLARPAPWAAPEAIQTTASSEIQPNLASLDEVTLTTTSVVSAPAPCLSFVEPLNVTIPVYTTYGTHAEVTIQGRVLEYADSPKACQKDSPATNLLRNLRALDSDEIPAVELNIHFNGKAYPAKTDKDGFFQISLKNQQGLQEGYHPVEVRLADGQDDRFSGAPGKGKVIIQTKSDHRVGIVSDIDDTIQHTGVTDKAELINNFLFKNATTLSSIPGMAELLQAIDQRSDGSVDGDVHYISGSPITYFERIDDFMQQNDFPTGSIDLMKMGFSKTDDAIFNQVDYKLGRIQKLFETYPQQKFVLFGDSGEKDPEIYRRIAQQYPDRVLAIYINNVSGEKPADSRFNGMLLTHNSLEAALDAFKRNLINKEDLQKVQQAVQKSIDSERMQKSVSA